MYPSRTVTITHYISVRNNVRNKLRGKTILRQVSVVPDMTEMTFTTVTYEVLADNHQITRLPSASDPFIFTYVLDPMKIFEMFRNVLVGNLEATLLGTISIRPLTKLWA